MGRFTRARWQSGACQLKACNHSPLLPPELSRASTVRWPPSFSGLPVHGRWHRMDRSCNVIVLNIPTAPLRIALGFQSWSPTAHIWWWACGIEANFMIGQWGSSFRPELWEGYLSGIETIVVATKMVNNSLNNYWQYATPEKNSRAPHTTPPINSCFSWCN